MFKCKTLSGDETLGRLCDYALNHRGGEWRRPHLFCFELRRERGDTWPFHLRGGGGGGQISTVWPIVFLKKMVTFCHSCAPCVALSVVVGVGGHHRLVNVQKKPRPFSESGRCIKCNVKTLVWSCTEFNTLLSAVLMIHTRDFPLLT